MTTKKKMLLPILLSRGLFSVLSAAVLLFASAGSFQFTGAWVFVITIIICAVGFGTWLYFSQPQQFENRFHEEKNVTQQRIIVLIGIVLVTTLILSGLDYRFSWSRTSVWRYCFAVPFLVCGLMIYANVFKSNPFLSNVVEIHDKQKVINTGLYGVVRHPMYLGTILAYIAFLFILGSWVNVIPLLFFLYLITVRINLEEKQLMNALPDYDDYCQHVKHKLFPFIW